MSWFFWFLVSDFLIETLTYCIYASGVPRKQLTTGAAAFCAVFNLGAAFGVLYYGGAL